MPTAAPAHRDTRQKQASKPRVVVLAAELYKLQTRLADEEAAVAATKAAIAVKQRELSEEATGKRK